MAILAKDQATGTPTRPTPDTSTEPAGHTTVPDDPGIKRLRLARWLRRLFMTLLSAFVVAGLLGLWGVKDGTAYATEEGWGLEFHYAKVTRAGLAVPLEWTITKAGGFGDEEPKVVLRMTDRYFDLFDENSFDPQPSTSWSDGEFSYWEFDAPPGGDAMRVSFDTRTGSGVQITKMKAETAIMIEDRALAPIKVTTWVMP